LINTVTEKNFLNQIVLCRASVLPEFLCVKTLAIDYDGFVSVFFRNGEYNSLMPRRKIRCLASQHLPDSQCACALGEVVILERGECEKEI
jgi:hypothetical protein